MVSFSVFYKSHILPHGDGFANQRFLSKGAYYITHMHTCIVHLPLTQITQNLVRLYQPSAFKKFARSKMCYRHRCALCEPSKQFFNLRDAQNKLDWLFEPWEMSQWSWWRHQMETFSPLLAICAGNSPVPGEFPPQRPGTRSFDVFFDLCRNKRLSKQS